MSATPQLPLALRPAPDLRFDCFIGAPEVVTCLAGLARGQGGSTLLSGVVGSGKTHLAIATAQAAAEAGLAVQYVPLAQLKGQVERGLTGLEWQQLVILDDLDAVLGVRGDEVALFDFHNRAHAAGTVLLYVARDVPSALPVDLPDLRSRLSQCTRLLLPRPDDELRAAILRQKAQARGWLLDDAALGYLLRHVGREMGSLVALLERLDRVSLAEQRRVTVPFIRSVLDEMSAPGA